jgi:hypothetical protein
MVVNISPHFFYHMFIESYSKHFVDDLLLILLNNVETLYIVIALQLGFSYLLIASQEII